MDGCMDILGTVVGSAAQGRPVPYCTNHHAIGDVEHGPVKIIFKPLIMIFGGPAFLRFCSPPGQNFRRGVMTKLPVGLEQVQKRHAAHYAMQ